MCSSDLTVMAPAQVIEPKDLPPELAVHAHGAGATMGSATAGNALTGALTGALSPHDATLEGLSSQAQSSSVPQAAVTGAWGGLSTSTGAQVGGRSWLTDLEREARSLLEAGDPQVWDILSREFEGKLITTALAVTRGRRIEAAQRLGIGRNTITRKIQELKLDD